MSRLRRLVLYDRFFFITCRGLPHRGRLTESEFECLARVVWQRRGKYHFLLTAWVFLPDHWHAIFFPRFPVTISIVMESIKVSRQIEGRAYEAKGAAGKWKEKNRRVSKERDSALPVVLHGSDRRALGRRTAESLKNETLRYLLCAFDHTSPGAGTTRCGDFDRSARLFKRATLPARSPSRRDPSPVPLRLKNAGSGTPSPQGEGY